MKFVTVRFDINGSVSARIIPGLQTGAREYRDGQLLHIASDPLLDHLSVDPDFEEIVGDDGVIHDGFLYFVEREDFHVLQAPIAPEDPRDPAYVVLQIRAEHVVSISTHSSPFKDPEFFRGHPADWDKTQIWKTVDRSRIQVNVRGSVWTVVNEGGQIIIRRPGGSVHVKERLIHRRVEEVQQPLIRPIVLEDLPLNLTTATRDEVIPYLLAQRDLHGEQFWRYTEMLSEAFGHEPSRLLHRPPPRPVHFVEE